MKFEGAPWYLATPYAKYPGGHYAAFRLAATECARLVAAGIPAFSPIAHTHPLADSGLMDGFEHSDWLDFDAVFMRVSRGLIMLKATSWQQSKGMEIERKHFAEARKPIVWMDPGHIPQELLECR